MEYGVRSTPYTVLRMLIGQNRVVVCERPIGKAAILLLTHQYAAIQYVAKKYPWISCATSHPPCLSSLPGIPTSVRFSRLSWLSLFFLLSRWSSHFVIRTTRPEYSIPGKGAVCRVPCAVCAITANGDAACRDRWGPGWSYSASLALPRKTFLFGSQQPDTILAAPSSCSQPVKRSFGRNVVGPREGTAFAILAAKGTQEEALSLPALARDVPRGPRTLRMDAQRPMRQLDRN